MPTVTAAQIAALPGGYSYTLGPAGLTLNTTGSPLEVYSAGGQFPVTYSGGASGTLIPGARVTFAAGLTIALSGPANALVSLAITPKTIVPAASFEGALILTPDRLTAEVTLMPPPNTGKVVLDTANSGVVTVMLAQTGNPIQTVSYWDTDSTGTSVGTINTLTWGQTITVAAGKYVAFSGAPLPLYAPAHLGFRKV